MEKKVCTYCKADAVDSLRICGTVTVEFCEDHEDDAYDDLYVNINNSARSLCSGAQ